MTEGEWFVRFQSENAEPEEKSLNPNFRQEFAEFPESSRKFT